MKRMPKIRRLSLTVHNWIGLLIAVQFLFWCVGGVVMSVLPIELVRGEVNITAQTPSVIDAHKLAFIIAQSSVNDIRHITAAKLAGRDVVKIERNDGTRLLYDAATGETISGIDAALAQQVAVNDYQHRSEDMGVPVAVQSVTLLTEEPGDYRRALPVWQVRLVDPDGTRIYVTVDTGEVAARRNDYWRFYDFFWMLHIMDYETRDDFNNPLIILASVTSTLFVFSGFILLYFRFWPKPKRRTKQKPF